MSKFDSRPRGRSPDGRRFGANNELRVDLYRHLRPQDQQQDQDSGAQGASIHWNDPGAQWNSGEVGNVWNALGLAPVIQTLFWVIETLEGEELDILESLDTLIDPLECPEELLDDIAASFGYKLKDDLSEEAKRVVVQGLFHAYKALGTYAGFKIFYRMVGFEIVSLYPLWKKEVHEENNDYSRSRYSTTPISGEAVGPAPNQAFRTRLGDAPVQPGTLRITDGSVILRDQPDGFESDGLFTDAAISGAAYAVGTIIGPTGNETGTINYGTGDLVVDFGAATTGAVTADYERVDEEWPYHAARIDIEIAMNPAGAPIPIVDDEVTQSILSRLDEVRPIHVLLRALTLVFELRDTVEPGASDAAACVETLVDIRDPYDITPGRHFLSFIDQGPYPPSDELAILQTGAVITDKVDQLLEDRAEWCVGFDLLEVIAGGSPLYY